MESESDTEQQTPPVSRRALLRTLPAIPLSAMFLNGCAERDTEAATATNRAPSHIGQGAGGMKYRSFGATDMRVSEVGFGAWAIGGAAYGPVDRADSLNALALAQELGCNFVDTAAVYGESEAVLGEFLVGRRDKWLVSSKYSAQPEGMTRTLEGQLRRLRVDVIDFYQIHWAPRRDEQALYDELYSLKRSGKVRYVGVSLKSALDIDFVIRNTLIDGFQVPCNLLEPYPYVARLEAIRKRRLGVVVRSALREGFLAGKFSRDTVFKDAGDQRSKWPREKISQLVDGVERFRFLERVPGTLAVSAARYPLAFSETSTVILGTKNARQAATNFGEVPKGSLSEDELARIASVQEELGTRRWLKEGLDRVRGTLGI